MWLLLTEMDFRIVTKLTFALCAALEGKKFQQATTLHTTVASHLALTPAVC
jgi:hypothetical protein